jgi:hypothetical protein
VTRATLYLDARGAEVGMAGGNEFRQQLERLSPRTQHGADQMMAARGMGHHVADEQALVNFEAVLVGLHAIALGGKLGLRGQNVGASAPRPPTAPYPPVATGRLHA